MTCDFQQCGILTSVVSDDYVKVRRGAKIRNQYNQVPHRPRIPHGKVTKTQLNFTNETFPSRWLQGSKEQMWKHDKHKTEITQMILKRSTALEWSVKYFTGGLKQVSRRQPHPKFRCGPRHIDVWLAWKTPNLSMYHLQEYINQDITRKASF